MRVIADTVPCNDGRIYTVELGHDIQKSDTLEMLFSGQFEVLNNNTNPIKEDNKGLISFNNGILRATEQSQWGPMLKTNKCHCYGTDIPFDYEIYVNPINYRSVYIGSGAPKNAV
jgi:hypothetical protein